MIVESFWLILALRWVSLLCAYHDHLPVGFKDTFSCLLLLGEHCPDQVHFIRDPQGIWCPWACLRGFRSPCYPSKGFLLCKSSHAVEYRHYLPLIRPLGRKSHILRSLSFWLNLFQKRDPRVESHSFWHVGSSSIPSNTLAKATELGFVIHGYLGGRVLIAKSIGLALSVASGLQLGKEGPVSAMIWIFSSVSYLWSTGNTVCPYCMLHREHYQSSSKQIWKKWSQTPGDLEVTEFSVFQGSSSEYMTSAACAAGVAVAFGAPIGGTLFSLEEVSYFFPAKVMWRR